MCIVHMVPLLCGGRSFARCTRQLSIGWQLAVTVAGAIAAVLPLWRQQARGSSVIGHMGTGGCVISLLLLDLLLLLLPLLLVCSANVQHVGLLALSFDGCRGHHRPCPV